MYTRPQGTCLYTRVLLRLYNTLHPFVYYPLKMCRCIIYLLCDRKKFVIVYCILCNIIEKSRVRSSQPSIHVETITDFRRIIVGLTLTIVQMSDIFSAHNITLVVLTIFDYRSICHQPVLYVVTYSISI